ncbi:MAG TPA: OsmC family protein [Trebonia sp.]|nr:OsmC family protein [Trebonia sp.]
MTADDTHRFVTIDRVSNSHYTVTNPRGGTIAVGRGDGTDFTPVELLLAAIGGCTAVDVDLVTSRRAEPESFRVDVEATKVSDDQGHHLTDIAVTFKVVFPDSDGGEKAREVLPGIVRQSHERLCTVSRTVEIGTPITTRIE